MADCDSENADMDVDNEELELMMMDDKCHMIDKIRYLYNSVIKITHNIHSPVFNPDIFAYLTENDFIDWVVG
jgi:hypothetical protein